jgi:hypothetical protein
MPSPTSIPAFLSDALGAERAEQVLARFDRYSNQPNAVRGASKLPSDPELERAALRVFDDPALGAVAGLDMSTLAGALDARALWGLLALAARADATVLDRLPAEVSEQGAAKLAMIRRAVAKHGAVLPSAPASSVAPATDGPALPDKVAQVARWVVAHPDTDPRRFAAHPTQRAAERRVALRALGALASPAALEVLAGYARDSYPDVELAELHRAWGNFDRREFAATMFLPGMFGLSLGECSSLEGIGAVDGLEELDALLRDDVDLAPLAECADLRRLRLNATGESGLTSVEPLVQLPALTELHLIGTTRSTDLTVLQEAPVERLSVSLDGADGAFLTRMPRLRSLVLSGGLVPEDTEWVDESGPARRAAHPGLVDVVLQLVRAGVDVVLPRLERSWVSQLLTAVPQDLCVVEQNGYVGLTRDASAADDLGRRLSLSSVP